MGVRIPPLLLTTFKKYIMKYSEKTTIRFIYVVFFTGIVAWISCKVMDITKSKDYLLFLNKRFINNTLILHDKLKNSIFSYNVI